MTTEAPAELSAAEEQGSSRRSMVVAAAGTITEWYEFSLGETAGRPLPNRV